MTVNKSVYKHFKSKKRCHKQTKILSLPFDPTTQKFEKQEWRQLVVHLMTCADAMKTGLFVARLKSCRIFHPLGTRTFNQMKLGITPEKEEYV